MNRSSGILMHISSLPGNYGIGTFGNEAYKFIDFLKKSGEKFWQVLPLGPTGYGDSPYQSFSAFAGNPYFIDLDTLNTDGILEDSDYSDIVFGDSEEKVNYGIIFNEKMSVLRKAYKNFKDIPDENFKEFCEEEKDWLNDYALYMSLKISYNFGNIYSWDDDLRLRDETALKEFEKANKEEIEFWKFIQYEFFKQWTALKDYANNNGIKIIGDIPIYVSEDSADVWANTDIFLLDEQTKKPIKVSGCPPDAFSETGQLWGNPIYNWDYLKKTGYEWWIKRISQNLKMYDVLRLDHFKGFESYWSIPYGDLTAQSGEWVKGPGIDFFSEIKKVFPHISMIAEDLGALTEETIKLREETSFPGMKILMFAFDSDSENPFLPHNYEKNFVAYTGTHDNDTIAGWIKDSATEAQINSAKRYFNIREDDDNSTFIKEFIRTLWSSVANTVVVQMQDLLELDNKSRMNTPSSFGDNWTWRMKKGAYDDKLSDRIKQLNITYGRLNK